MREKHGVHNNLPNSLLAWVAPIPNERKPKGHRSNFQGPKWLSFSGTSFSDCVSRESQRETSRFRFSHIILRTEKSHRETSSKVWAPVKGQSISLPHNGRFGALWFLQEPSSPTCNILGNPSFASVLDNLFGPLVVDMRFSGHGSGPSVLRSYFLFQGFSFRISGFSQGLPEKGAQKANQHLYTSAPPKRIMTHTHT